MDNKSNVMKGIIKDAAILLVITLIAGLCLGGVFEITKTSRAEQEKKRTQNAYKEVYKDAKEFKDITFDEEAMKKFIEEKGLSSNKVEVNNVVNAIVDKEDGYIITVTDKEGYGGNIKITVGIKNDGTVLGVSILSISETAGLGMNAKEPSFLNQFKDKNVEKFKYTKTGKKSDDEIDALSAATITSNAMTNGVNAALYGFQFLNGGEK